MEFLFGILGIAVCAVLIAFIRALASRPERAPEPPLRERALDRDAIAEHLGGAIRIPSVCFDKIEERDYSQWTRFGEYLCSTYPLMHQSMELEVLGGYALLYRWRGKNPGKKPILLMAHMDVVPVAEGTLNEWKYPPFSGQIAEGCVWGRGAIDMKGSLIAIAEACETLLKEGFVPERDIYVSFGQNEEAAGESDACNTARLFQDRGVEFEFILDEGGAMLDGAPFGISGKIAALGVSEKGYIDVVLRAKGSGGHSSRPPKRTALVELSRALVRLSQTSMRARIEGPTRELLVTLAPHMRAGRRFVYSNLWLFGAFVKSAYQKDAATNAMIRTTFAPTQARGSDAPNVLPDCAQAVVNVRVAPWDTVQGAIGHIRRAIAPCGVTIGEIPLAAEPSAVTKTDEAAYRYVASIVRRCFQGFIVAPYPMLGATDSRYFTGLTRSVIRFVPFRSLERDIETMHGVNERVAIDSLAEGVEFFIGIIEHLSDGTLP
ncbi:MAG: M20/M25/M40 family metallo-hydrolase [Bacillota bacterium]